jgi:iron complex transport system ATP-binding protein
MTDLLVWDNVDFAYGSEFKIQRASCLLKEGDFTLFLGPNGAGKTTLFKLASGILHPTSGQLILEGKTLTHYKPIERARRIAYLEQETQYLFPFTVEESVLMGRFPYNANHYWDRKEDLEIASWAMEVTGTLHFAKRSIFQLSGGERRKVEIARALCQRPKILLLDEPTTFLDLKQQLELFELLKKLNQEERITIGFISHQIGLSQHFAKQAIFVQGGTVTHQGEARQLLTHEAIAECFGIMRLDALNLG